MSLKGPLSEGNPVPRAFFEERNLTTFLALVGSQWEWIFLVLAAGGAYFAPRNVRASNFISSRKLGVCYPLAMLCGWIPTFGRLALGPSTNLVAIIYPTTDFATFLSIFFTLLILSDFLLTAFRFRVKNNASLGLPNE